MKPLSRRSFIRWVLASGAAMSCPFPGSGEEQGAAPGAVPQRLKSEEKATCHRVREGDKLPAPQASRSADLVIVGAGPSGLAAADRAQGADFLLLEKEPQIGGNCHAEEWEGAYYSTGAAWVSFFGDRVQSLFTRWKFDLHEIRGLDATCYEGKWIPGFWDSNPDSPAFDALPYPDSVKKSMRDFCRWLDGIDLEKDLARYDALPFSDFLKGYAPQIEQYWDYFGPSNWGARAHETSAYMGLQAAKIWPKDKRYSWPGGLGIGARRIYESLSDSAKKRVELGAAVYRVEREGKGAIVRYFAGGEAHAVRAKAVVMAAPKLIAKHLVAGLPDEQRRAMDGMRYAPFMIYNLCFDRVVYNQAYDNWVIGAKHFSDFIPADYCRYADGGDLSRKQVITVYAPLPEDAREDLTDDGKTLARAKAAVDELGALFPSWAEHLREVRVHRRGHPMPKSIPGWYTKLQPAARKDFGPVFFGHSDSSGEVSDLAYGAMNGIDAAEKALKLI